MAVRRGAFVLVAGQHDLRQHSHLIQGDLAPCDVVFPAYLAHRDDIVEFPRDDNPFHESGHVESLDRFSRYPVQYQPIARRRVVLLREDLLYVLRRRELVQHLVDEGVQRPFVEVVPAAHGPGLDQPEGQRLVVFRQLRLAGVPVGRPRRVALGRRPVRHAGRQIDVRIPVHQAFGNVHALVHHRPHPVHVLPHAGEEVMDDHLGEILRQVVQQHLPVLEGDEGGEGDPVAFAVGVSRHDLGPPRSPAVVGLEPELLVGAAVPGHGVHHPLRLPGQAFEPFTVPGAEGLARCGQAMVEDAGQVGATDIHQVEAVHGRIFERIVPGQQDFEHVVEPRQKPDEPFYRAGRETGKQGAVPVAVKGAVVGAGIEVGHDRFGENPDGRASAFRRRTVPPAVPPLDVVFRVQIRRIPGQLRVEIHGHHVPMIGLRRHHEALKVLRPGMVRQRPGVVDRRFDVAVGIGLPAALAAHARGPRQAPVIVASQEVVHAAAVVEEHVADHGQAGVPDRPRLGGRRGVVRAHPRAEQHRLRIAVPDGLDHAVDGRAGKFGGPVRVFLHPGLLRGKPQAVQVVRAQRLCVGFHHGGGEPPGHRVSRVEDDLGFAAPLEGRDPDLFAGHGLVPVHEFLQLPTVRIGREPRIDRGRAHVELHAVPDTDARLPGIVEDAPQQRDALLLPVRQRHRNTQAVGRQRTDAAAVRDVAALENVEALLDQVVDPGFELLPRPPAYAAVGVLHVCEIHPPLEAGCAAVLQLAYRDGISPGNLLAFFEETATQVFFEKPVHGVQRGVGPAAGEHQAVAGGPDNVAIASQRGLGKIDGEFRGRPPDVYLARGVPEAGMRPIGTGRRWPPTRLPMSRLPMSRVPMYGQFNTAHAP